MSERDPVAHYYDRNTRRFLRFGGGGGALAIHRELWGPGVRTATEAKRYVNRLLGDRIEAQAGGGDPTMQDARTANPVVVDLGCGVGGTLFDLAERFAGGAFHGVTVSPEQVALARDLADRRGVGARVRFHLGDFEKLGAVPDARSVAGPGARAPVVPAHDPAALPGNADAVVSIEAFAHASDPDAFFRTAARCAGTPGALLLLVDDFIARPADTLDPQERLWVRTFAEGWRLGTVRTPGEVSALARPAGFSRREEVDLTPLIRLGRPRDRVIRLLAPVLERLGLARIPFFGNMVGGNALQEGLRHGVLTYRMLVFERVASGTTAPRA